MPNTSYLIRKLAIIATLLALAVVMLGAFTRLSDAGLGCPDWPGCYGHAVVPKAQTQIDPLYAATPLESAKAWTEMTHRYFAGALATLCIILGIVNLLPSKTQRTPKWIPILLIVMIVFQALLGMWTVTLKLLPAVVMGHLLGGMTLLSLLWLTALYAMPAPRQPTQNLSKFKPWAILGLIIVATQIALGGWVSSNYAALACPTFPVCHGSLFPPMDLRHAFNFLSPIGTNYFGGTLDAPARVAIQMVHRYGAFITATYIGLLALWLLLTRKDLRVLGGVLLSLLLIQFSLGVMNVIKLLPLPIAISHNGVAALLLLTLITLVYRVCRQPQ